MGWIISSSITTAQVESSKTIAKSQLIKDYASLLIQASDDNERQTILDFLVILKTNGIEIPLPLKSILTDLKQDSRDNQILQTISILLNETDEERLNSYFGSDD